MEPNQGEQAVEQTHLESTLAVARVQWNEIAERRQKRAAEIQAAQEEMLERVTYDIGGLYSAQGFLDLLELNQDEAPLASEAKAQQKDDDAMRALARLMKTPYFARIDFQREGDDTPRQVYIGRATLMEHGTLAIHVYDWRTPIASLFYRYGTGPASYQAPGGEISGKISLKRQYEIRNGELLYFFDVDVQVVDVFLRDLLSRPASIEMKSIVETIQRDQDSVIRDLTSDLLMVQGTAGSGKTSVAMHRVAYLMYQGLNDKRLSAEEILILSPNAVFERYISHVLPELGERHVQTVLFEELFERILQGARIQSRSEWIEKWLNTSSAWEKAAMRRTRAFKGSNVFIALLDRLVQDLPRRWLPFSDVHYAGQCVVSRNAMKVEVCNSKKMAPIGIRLGWLEHRIFQRIHALRPTRMEALMAFASSKTESLYEAIPYARMLSIHESACLLRQIRQFTRVDVKALYRSIFSDPTALAYLSRGLLSQDEMDDIRMTTLKALGEDEIPYGDAAAIAYLQARIYGRRAYTSIRQVVLDEAQDADAMHMALLASLFPKARFTILGDIHQAMGGAVDLSIYDDAGDMLKKPHSKLVILDKSFRSTREIWAFSANFLPPGTAGDCFSRSGELPGIHIADGAEAMDSMIIEEVYACQAKGYGTIALLCKTERNAMALYERLSNRVSIRLVQDGGILDTYGAFVIPLFVAKGLEFDAVLLCDAEDANYSEEEDQKLLYIASTRALHRLSLFSAGKPSRFLPIGKEGR